MGARSGDMDPGLLMHLKPAEGSPRPVGRAIVDHLFDEDETGRIPIVGVAGTQGTHTIARLVAWLLHLSGKRVGLACRDGLFLDTRRIETKDCAHWEPAHRLLINRSMEAAVIENGAASILRDGLAYDRCTVGIVTDLGGASTLAEFDITEDDQLVKVLRTQVDVVLAEGVAVLNAVDERVAAMAELCDGSAILYGIDPLLPATIAHRATEGRAVVIHKGHIMLATGSAEVPLVNLERLTANWTTPAQLEPILASIAAAWAMDISPDLIVAGLKTFELDLPTVRPTPPVRATLPPAAPRTEHEDRKTD